MRRAFLSCLVVVMCFGFATSFVFADALVRGTLNRAAPAAGLNNICSASSCVPQIIGGLIQIVIGLLGLAMIGYFLYGGYLWMAAGGEKKAVEEAQKVIRNAVIGVAIIGLAAVLSGAVLNVLLDSFGPSRETQLPGAAQPGTEPSAGPRETPSAPSTNPFAPGCTRSSCIALAVEQNCRSLGQARETCERSVRMNCTSRCALDAPVEGRAPQTPVSTPETPGCRNPAAYRTCRTGCDATAERRTSSIADATERRRRYEEEVRLCNDRCVSENCIYELRFR